MSEKPKTARSYRGTMVSDNAIISINVKWLGQMLVLVAGLVYGYYRIETRIGNLEQEIQKWYKLNIFGKDKRKK